MKEYKSLEATLASTLQRKGEAYDRIVTLKETILSLEEQLENVRSERADVELRTKDLKTYGSSNLMY